MKNKRKKSATKGHIAYDSTGMNLDDTGKAPEPRSRAVVAYGWKSGR